jgi:hypothetical protein
MSDEEAKELNTSDDAELANALEGIHLRDDKREVVELKKLSVIAANKDGNITTARKAMKDSLGMLLMKKDQAQSLQQACSSADDIIRLANDSQRKVLFRAPSSYSDRDSFRRSFVRCVFFPWLVKHRW